MPYKRKTNRRRYNKRKLNTPITKARYTSASKVGIPNSVIVKLRYADTGLVRGTSSQTLEVHEHRMTSVYDPVVAVGGGQPLWFDQYATMYRNYTVYGCLVTCSGVLDKQQTNPCVFAMIPARDSSATFTHTDIMQKAGVRHTKVVHEKPFKISQYYSMAQLDGQSKAKYNANEDFSSPVTTNPSNNLFIYTGCCSMTGSETTGVEYDLQIVYYVKFWDRKNVSDV